MEQYPDIQYIADYIDNEKATLLYQQIYENTAWKQESIRIMGKWIAEPRLTAWYGSAGYTYSGKQLQPKAPYATLQKLMDELNEFCGTSCNSMLLNLYRDGRDSMGWHADDEPELGNNPVIVSLSLGASRDLRFRLKKQPLITHSLTLDHGSVLIMKGNTQHLWNHALPKRLRCITPRINITFRTIKK